MTILADSLNKLVNSNLRNLTFEVQSRWAPSGELWSKCLTDPRHLQSLRLFDVLMPELPNSIAVAHRLAHAVLEIQELRSHHVRVLAKLHCLSYHELRAYTIPEKRIINPHSDDELTRLAFVPPTKLRLQRLRIELDARGQGAMQLQEGSPVGGIEHLSSLEEIVLFIYVKCGQGSKIEFACSNAISRHPNSQAMKIYVHVLEKDENGKFVRVIRNTDDWCSEED